MLNTILFLAQATVPESIENLRKSAKPAANPLANTDLTIILGCVLALAAILFFWAFFLRKRPKHARGALVVSRAHKTRSSRSDDEEGESGRKRRRKRRPDHPDNWKRNPTLGETGGLPPVRQADDHEESEDVSDEGAPGGSGHRPVQPR